MLVSIIVPIYNVESFLQRCISSIVSQTYDKIEIILVDDGSTDSCPQKIKDWMECDGRIKVVSKKNGGLVSARQAGLSIATGEYVLYVDGDDWLERNCVEAFVSILEKNDVDLICCYATYYFKDFQKVYKIPYRTGLYDKKNLQKEIYPSLIHDKKLKYFPPTAWAKIFKRNLLLPKQMNVNPRIVMGEDGAFTKPYILSISSMYILDKCLYCYNNMNSESITHAKKVLVWEVPEMISDIYKTSASCQEYSFNDQINRYLVHSLFNVAVSQFHRKTSYGEISEDIKMHLSKRIVHKAFCDADFSCWQGKFARFTLKYKIVFLIYLYWLKKFGR